MVTHTYLSASGHMLFSLFVVSNSFTTSWTHSPPGSSVCRISQARIPDWVAISSSRRSSRPRGQTRTSCIAGVFFAAEPWGNLHLDTYMLLFSPPTKEELSCLSEGQLYSYGLDSILFCKRRNIIPAVLSFDSYIINCPLVESFP